ncbi:MAG: hypothetical protein Q8L65_06955 [Burkholderiales bacterium]|nr:hypothetical protein [Burkholderiales bacterium]MDP2398965.1 hypothetical protein [Burkholderiales bacterium]
MNNKFPEILELNTLSGIALSHEENYLYYENLESYPLRQRLIKVTRYCWFHLTENKFSENTVKTVCQIIRDEGIEWQAYCDFEAFNDYEEGELKEVTGDHPITPGNSLARYEINCIPPLRAWAFSADLQTSLEVKEEDWISKLPLSEEGKHWQWSDINFAAALVAVDYSARHLMADEPYKAGAWCATAYEHYGMGLGLSWSDNAATELAKIGANHRHAKNRETKANAIKIYESRTWPSQNEAARKIAREVNITEFVVLRWIREHRKKSTLPAE